MTTPDFLKGAKKTNKVPDFLQKARKVSSGVDSKTTRTPFKDDPLSDPTSGISRGLKGAGRELKGLGKFALGAGKLAGRGVAAGIKAPFERATPETMEQKRQEFNDFREKVSRAIDHIPDFAKSSVADFAETFGIVPDPESEAQVPVKFDKLAAINSRLDRPITSTLDTLFLFGIARKLGVGILSAGVKPAAKKGVQKILSKGELEASEFAKIAGTKPAKEIERLYRFTDELAIKPKGKALTIKQLDSSIFGEELGRSFINGLKRLKRRDQIKLNSAVSKIKSEAVNKTVIKQEIVDEFDKLGLMKGGGVVPEIDVNKVTRELKQLTGRKKLTAGELKRRINNMDKSINFQANDDVNNAMKAIRRSYRSELRRLSPQYDEAALKVSKKIDLLDENVRSIEKAGAGEKIGNKILTTDEEFNMFMDLMENYPDKFAGTVKARARARGAWIAWNKFFKQNDHSIGRVPVVPGAVSVDPGVFIIPIKKRLDKLKITGRSIGLKPLPKIKHKKLKTRGLLEITKEEEE